MRSKTIAAMLLAAGLPAVSVAAEDAAADEGSEISKWSGDIGVGLLFKRGNTNSDSTNANVNMARDSEKWRHTFKADANNEKEEDPDTEEYNRTDENYFASYKLDRKLGEDAKNYLFNVLTYQKDNFSGYHYEASYAIGVGRRWIDSDLQTLDAEIGPGYSVKCLEPQDTYMSCHNSEEDAIARIGIKYELRVSDNTTFKEDFSTEVGEEGSDTRAETSLTTAINSSFALRLRHLLEHNSSVPPGTKETDHTFSVGVVYTLQ
jgi:putative salt-induced outer membrane protein YdiY